MPKDTFLNLPEEKKELICKVAIAEFAEHGFGQASINRIVENSGIAKGSFYQYFEDKRDLFWYLLELAGEEKARYVSPVLANPEAQDFFSLLRDMYVAGIRFASEHPDYARISVRLMANRDADIYQEMLAKYSPSAHDLFEPLLERAMARGEVRDDLDIKMAAYMIASMNAHVVEYYYRHVAPEYDEKMMGTIDQFIDLLKDGIGARSTGASHRRRGE